MSVLNTTNSGVLVLVLRVVSITRNSSRRITLEVVAPSKFMAGRLSALGEGEFRKI